MVLLPAQHKAVPRTAPALGGKATEIPYVGFFNKAFSFQYMVVKGG